MQSQSHTVPLSVNMSFPKVVRVNFGGSTYKSSYYNYNNKNLLCIHYKNNAFSMCLCGVISLQRVTRSHGHNKILQPAVAVEVADTLRPTNTTTSDFLTYENIQIDTLYNNSKVYNE
jgi:hypothetical protein